MNSSIYDQHDHTRLTASKTEVEHNGLEGGCVLVILYINVRDNPILLCSQMESSCWPNAVTRVRDMTVAAMNSFG